MWSSCSSSGLVRGRDGDRRAPRARAGRGDDAGSSQELVELSDRVRVRVVERDEPGRYPALTIGDGLRYHGLPWGYELSSLVYGIAEAGRAERDACRRDARGACRPRAGRRARGLRHSDLTALPAGRAAGAPIRARVRSRARGRGRGVRVPAVRRPAFGLCRAGGRRRRPPAAGPATCPRPCSSSGSWRRRT